MKYKVFFMFYIHLHNNSTSVLSCPGKPLRFSYTVIFPRPLSCSVIHFSKVA
jgi:hypothetical protein